MKTLAIALTVLLIIPACGSVPATRETPEGTVEMFKAFNKRGDRAGEWDILSPGLKRRLSQRAGRNVDLADYETIIETYRKDTRVRLAETLLQTATVTDKQMVSEDTARVTIQAGGPLGKSATVTMRRLMKWELQTVSDPEPYWGIVGDAAIQITRGADGSYTLSTPDGWTETFAASEVEAYNVSNQWYVDSLGELEGDFMSGAGA